MTDKEKRELKDGVISIFKRFNILDHTATIGGLRDDILRYINSLQEKPKPLFKVGDIICNKQWKTAAHKIVSMDDKAYYLENEGKVEIAHQELWEVAGEQANNDLEKNRV